MKCQCPNIYYWIGLKISHHPIIIFDLILLFMGILLCGLIFTDFEVKEKSGEEMFFEYLRPNMYTVWRTLWKKDFLLR